MRALARNGKGAARFDDYRRGVDTVPERALDMR